VAIEAMVNAKARGERFASTRDTQRVAELVAPIGDGLTPPVRKQPTTAGVGLHRYTMAPLTAETLSEARWVGLRVAKSGASGPHRASGTKP
jgi:hypothetical protein